MRDIFWEILSTLWSNRFEISHWSRLNQLKNALDVQEYFQFIEGVQIKVLLKTRRSNAFARGKTIKMIILSFGRSSMKNIIYKIFLSLFLHVELFCELLYHFPHLMAWEVRFSAMNERKIHDSSESHLQQLLTKLNPLSSLTSLMSTVRNLWKILRGKRTWNVKSHFGNLWNFQFRVGKNVLWLI